MALIIKKSIQTAIGIEINTDYYLRLTVTIIENGSLRIDIKDYVSKTNFKAEKQPLPSKFISGLETEYTRENDGIDTQLFAHQKVKAFLVENFGLLENEVEIDLETNIINGNVNEI